MVLHENIISKSDFAKPTQHAYLLIDNGSYQHMMMVHIYICRVL